MLKMVELRLMLRISVVRMIVVRLGCLEKECNVSRKLSLRLVERCEVMEFFVGLICDFGESIDVFGRLGWSFFSRFLRWFCWLVSYFLVVFFVLRLRFLKVVLLCSICVSFFLMWLCLVVVVLRVLILICRVWCYVVSWGLLR